MQNKESFTLIEILIVIAIIGILAGILIISMSNATNSANDAKRKADINQITKSLLIYNASNEDYPASTTPCSIGNSCSGDVNTALGDSVNARDPSGGYYTYWSDGTYFIVNAVMSDDSTYSYNSSTSTYTSNAVVPICGTAQKTFYATSSTFGSNTFCSVGTVVSAPSFPAIGATATWVCRENGTDANCSADRAASACITIPGQLQCVESIVGTDTINIYTLLSSATASTDWTVPDGVTQVEYLVVAGGGGGGGTYGSGGGGAGGYLTNYGGTKLTVSGEIDITVGAGGAPSTIGNYNAGIGFNGGNSIFDNITAIGGGGGAYGNVGALGGSSGGSSRTTSTNAGTAGQGTRGGTGYDYPCYSSGGGGGAGGAGGNGTTTKGGYSGSGGIGLQNAITGTVTWYAGGGGGGGDYYHGRSYAGTGGSSIGGNGATGTVVGGNGMANTGSGGGGAAQTTSGTGVVGGSGGSGIVVVRFATP
ncbi:MAG: prepilin-type N-terminal cleavage/methylation domain-containing protein [Candidatus Pacebacteria bacterium]|nr:prepilin-type N-terminal cleavage/methylation domain-containing protein [Candidatus Paceibacterota bacterium]